MMYGDLPEVLGVIDLNPVEMMCWMYCPISTPNETVTVPANLRQFLPIIEAVCADNPVRFVNSYVYLTAKTLYVSGGNIGNRPGWHTDGFGTDDLNYIWYDKAPTEFYADRPFSLPDNCDDAMARMTEEARGAFKRTFPAKHLLKLTPTVVHRPPVTFEAGMRTFVKVSISDDRYNLEGNSINHGLSEQWPLVPRQMERNHPAQQVAA